MKSKKLSKILVIDDELNMRQLVKAILSDVGYQVLTANDGEKGLKLAELEKPDLILSDLRMPGVSGWDVLITLKNSQKLGEIPVIIMTGAMPKGEEYRIRSMRAAGYLGKPFDVDELIRQVEQVLGK